MKFFSPRAISVRCRFAGRNPIDRRRAVFTANSFIASMMAVYIAFQLDLQRPYWAMLTVYLTTQPLAGAVRSKALFRVVGTVLGASAAVILVPAFVNEPLLLSLAITGWSGFCLYVSLLDRTPRSYMFMLAGYTATTIAFSSVTTPDAVFMTALARVEEITLGIACATIVHGVLFPRDVSSVLKERVTKSVRDAGIWMADALLGYGTKAGNRDQIRLAFDVTELEMLSTHLPFDTAAAKPQLWAVRVLQNRLATVLPLIAELEDRLVTLRAARVPMSELDDLARESAEWARDPQAPQDGAGRLRRQCEDVKPKIVPRSTTDWPTLLAVSATANLYALIDALSDSRELAALITEPVAGRRGPSGPSRRLARRYLHRDRGLAGLSVFALIVAVLGCCVVWIATGWPEGGTAAQMAAIYAALFGSLDDPAPDLLSFVLWTAASLPVAAIYLFAVFPAIDGFPMLVATLAPAFLVMGYLQSDPRHTLKALALLIGVIGALDLQPRFYADFISFANVNSAEVVGIAASFLVMRMFRSITAAGMARRLLQRGWRDLADLAAVRRPVDRDRWLSVMLDRLGLVTTRIALAGAEAEAETEDALTALQVGLDLIDLKSTQDAQGILDGGAVVKALAGISRMYRSRADGLTVDRNTSSEVLSAIDSALREAGTAVPEPTRRRGLVALTGLRRTLFPKAPPFISEAQS